MASTPSVGQSVAAIALPAPTPDGQPTYPRLGRYGENIGWNLPDGVQALAEEGSYFVTTNPTPLTGIAGHAAPTTLDDTKPALLVKNNHATKNIYIDFLRWRLTVAGANGTLLACAAKIDSLTSRYTSGGSSLTPQNCNMNSGNASSALVYNGAVVASAAGASARLLDFTQLRTVIPVVGDIYQFDFGKNARQFGSKLAAVVSGTAESYQQFAFPPAIIGPGQIFLFHFWETAQSAANSWELTMGHWER